MSYLKDFCEIITKGTTPSTYGYSFKFRHKVYQVRKYN